MMKRRLVLALFVTIIFHAPSHGFWFRSCCHRAAPASPHHPLCPTLLQSEVHDENFIQEEGADDDEEQLLGLGNIGGKKNDDDDDGYPSLEELFGSRGGRGGVKYCLQHHGDHDDDDLSDTPFKMSSHYGIGNRQREIFEVALMPFESPLPPSAREMLFIYEMRFRSLFNDVEREGNVLGRCFVSPNNAIGLVGSLCKIVEQKKMRDGKGFYIIEAYSRFRIRRIVKLEPYLRAEVELIDDVQVAGDSELCEVLCQEVYSELKTYLRMAKMQRVDLEGEETIGISPAIRDNRPLSSRRKISSMGRSALGSGGGGGQWHHHHRHIHGRVVDDYALEIDGGARRHQAFSHACASLLATDPEVMQQLLQSQSTSYRLVGLKRILAEAVEELGSLMITDESLTPEEFAFIRQAAKDHDDDESDLMPPSDFAGVTLESELDDDLKAELGITDKVFVDFNQNGVKVGDQSVGGAMRSTVGGMYAGHNMMGGSSSSTSSSSSSTAASAPAAATALESSTRSMIGDGSEFDNVWDCGEAFQ